MSPDNTSNPVKPYTPGSLSSALSNSAVSATKAQVCEQNSKRLDLAKWKAHSAALLCFVAEGSA